MMWWSGITLDTPIRNIGWTWVVMVVLIAILIRLLIELKDTL